MNVRGDRERKRRGSMLLAVLVGLATPGCFTTNASLTATFPGYRTDVSTIQVVSTVVGGKNVFIPSTIVVTGGVPQVLSIYNTADQPHGFAIKGIGIEAVLLAGQETRVELPPLEGAQILQINCHLHPPHRTASLVVVPGL
jgi:hypothetical protein